MKFQKKLNGGKVVSFGLNENINCSYGNHTTSINGIRNLLVPDDIIFDEVKCFYRSV